MLKKSHSQVSVSHYSLPLFSPRPITLGADPGGGHYFQLGEIEVR